MRYHLEPVVFYEKKINFHHKLCDKYIVELYAAGCRPEKKDFLFLCAAIAAFPVSGFFFFLIFFFIKNFEADLLLYYTYIRT